MRHEEIEVKFLIEDLVAMRQRLVALGATPSLGARVVYYACAVIDVIVSRIRSLRHTTM